MSIGRLAEVYERLKERRRRGGVNFEQSGIFEGALKQDVSEEMEAVSRLIGRLAVDIDGPDQDAGLIRTLEIKTLADRVFGNEEKAETWLQRSNASLSGQRPVDLLKDELGAAVVREMLERIDHGIFA